MGVSTKALKEGKKIREGEKGMVLPPPPIPTAVKQSRVEEVIPKEDKSVAPAPVVEEHVEEREEVKKEAVVGEYKGTITVHLYHNKTYEVKFDGNIVGGDLMVVYRSILKQYRVWKHNLVKEGGK